MGNRKQFKKIEAAKATTTPPQKNALIKTLLQNLLFNNWAPPGLPLWKIGKAQFFIWILIKGPSISASSQFSKWAIEAAKASGQMWDLIKQ